MDDLLHRLELAVTDPAGNLVTSRMAADALAEIQRLRGRVDDLLVANNAFEARAREAERTLRYLTTVQETRR